MTKEEYREIVDNLFAGNRLARGIKLPSGPKIDLKNITSPVVVFASWGDNISPPQQALNWIDDVYGHEDRIVALGRVIVYLLAEDAGHLSIFVGGQGRQEGAPRADQRDGHARRTAPRPVRDGHRAAAQARGPAGHRPGYVHRALRDADRGRHPRLNPDRRSGEALFSTINQVSERTERLYESLYGPVVRALSSEATARLLRWLHPLRVRQYLFSGLNPSLAALPLIAEPVRQHRHPASEDNAFLQLEHAVSKQIVAALNYYRDLRDSWAVQMVKLAYGPLGLGAFFPPEPLGGPGREDGRGADRRRSSPPCGASSSGAASPRRSPGC